MFEVGKKVIAIQSHSRGLFKKGDQFIVLGIKDGFCKCEHTMIDIGLTSENEFLKCIKCHSISKKSDSKIWFMSHMFVPLSDLTADQLIEQLEKEVCYA